jgi:peptide/nickel transport system substrate-binding protein
LAEAGYPDGFEMEYNVYTPVRWLGEAVAGQLRKVGIRAKIQPVTIGVYRRKQRAGELQAWSILFPTASHPDASNILAVYFRGPAFKYYNDPALRAGMDAGETEFDVSKRADHYEKVFNRVNEKHYIFPVTSIPSVFAHTNTVVAQRDQLSAGDIWNGNWAWK